MRLANRRRNFTVSRETEERKMKGRTYYSNKIKGARGNYGWPAKYDITGGYLGITQYEDGKVKDRVLLSPTQLKKLSEFVEKKHR